MSDLRTAELERELTRLRKEFYQSRDTWAALVGRLRQENATLHSQVLQQAHDLAQMRMDPKARQMVYDPYFDGLVQRDRLHGVQPPLPGADPRLLNRSQLAGAWGSEGEQALRQAAILDCIGVEVRFTGDKGQSAAATVAAKPQIVPRVDDSQDCARFVFNGCLYPTQCQKAGRCLGKVQHGDALAAQAAKAPDPRSDALARAMLFDQTLDGYAQRRPLDNNPE